MRTQTASIAAARRPFSFVALFCCLAAMGWAAGNQKVAEAQITPGQVSWKTIAEAQGWTLTVSGQGIYLRERYEDSETPTLRPTAPDGERLPDGIYHWELRAINPERRESSTTRRAPARTRRMRTERGTFERRVVEQPVVTSGSFRIQGGGFVMPQPNPHQVGFR